MIQQKTRIKDFFGQEIFFDKLQFSFIFLDLLQMYLDFVTF